MFDKIVKDIEEKIKPAIEAGRKQAELAMLVNTAVQIYSANLMRGVEPSIIFSVATASAIIKEAREAR
jgi:hypothetical protein